MANSAPTGVNKILVEKYGYEWVNGKAWRPGTAPKPEVPTIDVTPGPLPDWITPPPADAFVTQALETLTNPVNGEKFTVPTGGYTVNVSAPTPIEDPSPTPNVPVATPEPEPAPSDPVSLEEKIEQLQASLSELQKKYEEALEKLEQANARIAELEGKQTETPVEDQSSSDLDPKPEATPSPTPEPEPSTPEAPAVETPEPAPTPSYPEPTGVNKILVEKYGYEWVNGKAWKPGTAPELFLKDNFEILATSERSTINFESASGFYNTHRQLFVQDLNGDGSSEVMLHFSAYPEFQEIPVVVMSKTSAGLQNISASIFDIVPKTQHNHQSQYIDLDLDGDNDLLIGDAGFDLPPWTGGGFDIYLQEEGIYEKLSIPEDLATVRTYAISGGDLDGDYKSEIVLQDSNEVLGLGKGPILKFSKQNDDYDFSISKTTLPDFWQYGNSSDLQILDIDQNGTLDLFIGNNWANPNYTIFFDGLDASKASRLPENHWGHTTYNSAMTQENSVGASADVNLFFDFDQDGDLDLFSIVEEVILTGNGENLTVDYHSGRGALQIYEQTSPKSFERTNQSDFDLYLGNKFYFSIQAQDFNSDDKVDVIAHYNSKENGDAGRAFNAGSTIFLNKGGLQFEAFDSVDFIGAFDGTNGLDQYGFLVPLTDTKNGVTETMLLVPMLAGFRETTDMHLEVQEIELKFLETEVPII